MAEEHGDICFTREMGISHAEFWRTLPSAVDNQAYTLRDDTVTIADASRTIEIRLSPERDRRLGSLTLPTTTIRFTFIGYSRSQIDRFMARFDLYFQRGGG